ncbi:unnamed protein product, partial [marine sediment metagenome]
CEDIKIVSDIFSRFAINFKSSLYFTKEIDVSVQEVSDKINRI